MRALAILGGVLLAALAALPMATLAAEASAEARALALPRAYPLQRQAVEARDWPWRAVVRLNWVGRRGFCTGVLVADRWAVTAAHCVNLPRAAPSDLRIQAGFQAGRALAHTAARAIRIADGGTLAADWALIELDAPLGAALGWLPWHTSEDAGAPEATRIALAGYRADRPWALTVGTDCRSLGTSADGFLRHDCPTAPGDSGGPVLRQTAAGDWLLVGIQVATARRAAPVPGADPAAAPPRALGLALPVAGALAAQLRALAPPPEAARPGAAAALRPFTGGSP